MISIQQKVEHRVALIKISWNFDDVCLNSPHIGCVALYVVNKYSSNLRYPQFLCKKIILWRQLM